MLSFGISEYAKAQPEAAAPPQQQQQQQQGMCNNDEIVCVCICAFICIYIILYKYYKWNVCTCTYIQCTFAKVPSISGDVHVLILNLLYIYISNCGRGAMYAVSTKNIPESFFNFRGNTRFDFSAVVFVRD